MEQAKTTIQKVTKKLCVSILTTLWAIGASVTERLSYIKYQPPRSV